MDASASAFEAWAFGLDLEDAAVDAVESRSDWSLLTVPKSESHSVWQHSERGDPGEAGLLQLSFEESEATSPNNGGG